MLESFFQVLNKVEETIKEENWNEAKKYLNVFNMYVKDIGNLYSLNNSIPLLENFSSVKYFLKKKNRYETLQTLNNLTQTLKDVEDYYKEINNRDPRFTGYLKQVKEQLKGFIKGNHLDLALNYYKKQEEHVKNIYEIMRRPRIIYDSFLKEVNQIYKAVKKQDKQLALSGLEEARVVLEQLVKALGDL